MVALGYNKILSIYHRENFAPVVNEIIFRIMLVMMMKNGWKAEIIDFETAFLYRELEKQIYMKKSEGLEEKY